MMIAIFTVFLQFQLASVYSETTTGKEILFTRVSDQLSWITAREACNNMSYAILPGMRAARALGKMHVGEFAWIDGKEYTFCYAKDVNETKEICRYVTVRREDANENLTYICNKDGQFEKNEELLPYADAEHKCLKSSASMQRVESFIIPMIIPVNRTDWIKDFNHTSIINRLSPGQTVTEICIGIVKLDHDSFEFRTTPCNESHTVICDETGINTALTLATRDEMMPRLGDSKAGIGSNQRKNVDMRLILTCLIIVILPVPIAIIAIVQYREKKFIKILAYHSKYRKQGRSLDRETLPRDGLLQRDIESVNNFNVKESIQDQSNNRGDNYDNTDPPLASSHCPMYNNNSSNPGHLHEHALLTKQASPCSKSKFGESEKYAFTARDCHHSDKCSTMNGTKNKTTIAMYRDDEEEYGKCNNVEILLEYQGDDARLREHQQV